MKYCTKCVQVDTRPNLYFDKDGVCGACLWEEEKERINWTSRGQQLHNIASKARAKKRDYDCAIGVSGGKDSTFQSLYARDVLGLRPLLVNSEPEGITPVGEHNIENLKQLGFDVISVRPNPVLMRELIRRDFYKHFNPCKITEHSLYASVHIIADKFDIPLIIQGENTGLTFGDSKCGTGTDGDALNADLGRTIENGLNEYLLDGYDIKDLFMFRWDSDRLRDKGTEGVWLNYYVKEYSLQNNLKFSQANGLKIRKMGMKPEEYGTYCRYSQLDGVLLEVNQYFKYIKFGFGQTTDHASADIRYGLITRDEGIALVKEFDGKCGERYLNSFLEYINVSKDEFDKLRLRFTGNMWGFPPLTKDGRLVNPIWEREDGWKKVRVKEVIQRIRDWEGDYGYDVDKRIRQVKEIEAVERRMKRNYAESLRKTKQGDTHTVCVSPSSGISICGSPRQ